MADAEESVSAHDAIRSALSENREELSGGPEAMLTGWYVVSEWVDSEGQRWLSRICDEESTVWARVGLLEFAVVNEKNDLVSD